MTVSSSVNKVIYSGNSATVLFPVSYYFLENSHLKVILRAADGTETVQALTTNYTVTGAGNPAGGSVTMLVAPPTGTTLTIVRNVPATQETDYLANDPFPAESHERALDKLTMLVQENEEVASRALVVPASTPTTVSTTLPNPTSLGILAWNQNANAINYISPSDIGTAVAYATAYADTFDCDGVDQTFTLTANPVVINNLDVSIQGAVQVPNVDYTLSGTTLTMTTPPPINSVLLAKYKQGLPNFSGDSQDIRYVPAGSGAVNTTVQAKLRETVSVKDFGAVGDGVTDDTAAIQAALTAHKNVHFPAGSYKISTALVLDNNHYLIGDGVGITTVNQITTDQYATTATSKTEIKISGITWVGTNSGIADGLYFTQCTYCVVESCEVNLFGHNGINFYRSSYCEAINNKCTGNRISGINVGGTTSSAAEYNKVIGNSCIANSSTGTYGGGIFFYINANYCIASENVCNLSVDGYGILVTDCIGTTVNNNTCKANTYSGLTYHYDDSANSLAYNLCDGNVSQGNGEHGIVFQSNSALTDLQVGNTISNNQCIGNGNVGGFNYGKGIYVASGARGFLISGNNCQSNYESGIEIAANVSRGGIVNNICHNNGVGGLASAAGIRLNDTSTEGTFACFNVLVSGNHCDDVGVGVQKYGIDLFTSLIEKTIVVGNSLRNNTVAPYRNNGTDSYIEDFLNDGTQNIVLANLRSIQINGSGAAGLNFLQDRSVSTNSARVFFSNATAGKSVALLNENNDLAFTTSGTPGSATGTTRAYVKDTGAINFVPLNADPSPAAKGDVYFNGSTNKLRCYNGTTWNDLF